MSTAFKEAPFMKKPATGGASPVPPSAPQAPQAPVAPQQTVEVPDAAPVTAAPKTRSTVEVTDAHFDYIMANLKTKSDAELAADTGLSKNQVSRVMTDQRALYRKKVKEAAEAAGVKAYSDMQRKGKGGVMMTVSNYEEPLTPEAATVEKYIAENLTRPDSMRPGGNKGGGVGEKVENRVTSVLAELGLSNLA